MIPIKGANIEMYEDFKTEFPEFKCLDHTYEIKFKSMDISLKIPTSDQFDLCLQFKNLLEVSHHDEELQNSHLLHIEKAQAKYKKRY